MDCDRPGREAAYRIFMDLAGVAADVKVIDLYPERDDGYDLTDLLRENDLAEARAYVRWLTEH
jgi:DNA primase